MDREVHTPSPRPSPGTDQRWVGGGSVRRNEKIDAPAVLVKWYDWPK